MKNIFLITFFAIFLLTACKKEETKLETKNPTVEETTAKSDCYLYDENNTRIELTLQLNEKKASGTIEYALAEKDKNTGTFEGIFENNILIADYTFQSEGKESVRQVAFQLQGEQLVEGYGELTADGTKFIDVSKISYNSTMPLTKTNCN